MTAPLLILATLMAMAAAVPAIPAETATMVPDTFFVSLQEALLMTLERNPTVAIQRLRPAVAATRVREESGAFEPRISAQAGTGRTRSQRFLGTSPSPFELTTEQVNTQIGISSRLPSGTTVAASASISGYLSSIYSDQYTGELGLTVTQSLLQGLSPGYHLAGLRRARLDADISRLELKAAAETITAQVEQAYWRLYLTDQEREIRAESLNLARAQLQETEERVAVGRLPELELAAVRAEVATRREAMIDAESRYEQARVGLLYLLNPPREDAWDLQPALSDRPFVPAVELDPVTLHEQLAMRYRADVAQAELDLRKGVLDLQRTRNGLLPRLDVFIALGRTTYAESFSASVPDPGSPFYSVSVGAALELPVTRREARARHARARYTHDQFELALNNMRRLVQRDVRSAYVEVGRARQQIEATGVARELQEKKVLAEQEKFRVGRSTNLLVLQAQRDFIASQLSEARAMVAYLEALVHLHLMQGTLLERRGIQPPNESRESVDPNKYRGSAAP